MNLARFIETFQEAITRAVLRTYPPVYSAQNRHQWGFGLRRLRRPPLGAQGERVAGQRASTSARPLLKAFRLMSGPSGGRP